MDGVLVRGSMQGMRHCVGHGLLAVVGGAGVAGCHAPALRPEYEYMGDMQRAMRAGIIFHIEHFAQVMNGNHRTLPVRLEFSLHANARIVEDTAPTLPDGQDAGQTNTGWMDAYRFLLLDRKSVV